MLQQRGYYTINLGDGKQIPLRFCTWSFMRFCELNSGTNESGNATPMTLFRLQSELTSGMTLKGINTLLLCAAEYMCIKNESEFKYTDMDASDWIDEMGGIVGSTFLEMIKIIIGSFTDSAPSRQEKKIPAKAKS